MANSNITNPCACPDGFTYDPITDLCVKGENLNPIFPVTPLYTGNVFDSVQQEGIISYGNINNYVWPLLSTPQDTTGNQANSLAAMTAIPASGNNAITGDSWTNINPPAQPGGQHAGIFTPPVPIPYPNPNPFGVTNNYNGLRPYSTSTIVGGTLNYGQGSYVPVTNFSASSFFKNWYSGVAVWAYTYNPQITFKWAGFLACVEPEVETTYQIIIACNNGLRVIIDDNLAVESLTGDGYTQALSYVNHFEITLSPGLHIIRVENYNYGGNGGLACDILECSAAQLYAVTTDAQLNPYRVFSSSWKKARAISFTANGTNVITTVQTTKSYDVGACFDVVGVPANVLVTAVLGPNTYQLSATVSSGNYNGYIRFLYDVSNIPQNTFSCPSGFTLTSCDGLACVRTLEVPCQEPAYYTLNDCCTNEPYQIDNEVLYLRYTGFCEPGTCPDDLINLIITTVYQEGGNFFEGCFKLTQLQNTPPEPVYDYGTIITSVDTVSTCADCQLCEPVYYTLNDCCTNQPYETEGKILYIEYDGQCYPNACPDNLINVVITSITNKFGLFAEGCFNLIEFQGIPPEGSSISNWYAGIESVQTVPTCEDCQICPTDYQLTDCSDPTNIVYTCSNLFQYLGSVIKLENCGDTCWIVETAPLGVESKPAGKVTDVKQTCEECLPTPPPPTIPKAKPRDIRPGYFIKNPCLTTEYVEKVNCTFSDQVYNQMVSVRYGISSCCETDVNKWDIKKEILDYELITIPKEEVYTPRTCYCYTITVMTGTASFKYISCEGDWCTVILTKGVLNVCSQNKPQADCIEPTVIYEITTSSIECESNNDCEQN